jgi:hypothetical protein
MSLRKRADRDGTCSLCHQPYSRGDRIVWREAAHEQCHPGAFATLPPAQTIEQVRLAALAALEDALITIAATNGVNVALEKQFDKYQKLKAVALRPGTSGEELAFLRAALIEAVKLVF